jgi:hypothetical protein
MDSATRRPRRHFVQFPAHPIGTVTSVDNVLKRVSSRTATTPAPAISVTTGGGYTLRVYRPAVTRSSRTSVAATNEIEFASVAGIAAGSDRRDRIRRRAARCRRRSRAGGARCSTASSSASSTAGRSPRRDEPRAEPFMRTWSGAANVAPDGWSLAGRHDDRAHDGSHAHRVRRVRRHRHFGNVGNLKTPPFRVWRIGSSQRTTVSLRIRITFTDVHRRHRARMLLQSVSGFTDTGCVLRALSDGSSHGRGRGQVRRRRAVRHCDHRDRRRRAQSLEPDHGRAVRANGAARRHCMRRVDVVQVTQTTYDPGAYIETSGAVAALGRREPLPRRVPRAGPRVRGGAARPRAARQSPWSNDRIVLGGKIGCGYAARDHRDAARDSVAPNELDPLATRVVLSNRLKTLTRLLDKLGLGNSTSSSSTGSGLTKTPGAPRSSSFTRPTRAPPGRRLRPSSIRRKQGRS